MELPYIQDIAGDKTETPIAPFAKLRPHPTKCHLRRHPQRLLQQRTRRTDHKNSSFHIAHNN